MKLITLLIISTIFITGCTVNKDYYQNHTLSNMTQLFPDSKILQTETNGGVILETNLYNKKRILYYRYENAYFNTIICLDGCN